MARRAVESFRAQTYENKLLIIWDQNFSGDMESHNIIHVEADHCVGASIGSLRNFANKFAGEENGHIIVHWDDDDYSHPNRITEQVEFLQASGADAVGYNPVLFWDTTKEVGEAWMYHNASSYYVIGASLCYWRRTWERIPFEDVSKGEDDRFIRKIIDTGGKVRKMLGIYGASEPRIIHHIHGSNTCAPEYAREVAHGSNNWVRAEYCDGWCKERMKL